jgi:hypothetical protein
MASKINEDTDVCMNLGRVAVSVNACKIESHKCFMIIYICNAILHPSVKSFRFHLILKSDRANNFLNFKLLRYIV